MKKVWYVLSMALILLIASCQSDNPSMITLGLDDTYVVERMKGLTLHPGSFLRVRFGICHRFDCGDDTRLYVCSE